MVKAGPSQPFAQISADCSNAIKPDAFDGGSKVVVVPRGDIGNDGIELPLNPIEVVGPYRKQSFSPQPGEKLELDVMDQRAALERIELVDGLRLEAWCQAVNGIEEEPVGAACVFLKGCRRIATNTEHVSGHYGA